MASAITESDRRFEIPGTAQVVEGNGGLPKVRITTREVAGKMYLHGAHVTSWKPTVGEEVLFLSAQSRWENGRAIRGGVPICFPWFGDKADDPKAPAHGFVRTKAWQIESIVQAGEAVTGGIDERIALRRRGRSLPYSGLTRTSVHFRVLLSASQPTQPCR